MPAFAQSGPVAAYGFNEATGTTAADASGNGQTGTISGATWKLAGKYGSALTFNGSTNWVTINHSALLSLTGAMTLEAWVQTASPSNWRTVILKERSGGLSYALYAGDDAGRVASFIRQSGDSGDTDATAPSVLGTNAWYHVATTFDGSTLKTYVNGVEVAATSAPGTIQASTLPVRIGGNAVWGEYFSGAIDEVRIYNRALTAGEIQNDMITPVGGATPDTYSISGAITPSSGGSGATVALTNFATASTTADVNGNFTFAGLRPGPYTVTPSRPGYTFTPPSRDVVIGEGGNVSGVNFTAAAIAATPSVVGAWSAPFDLGMVAVDMILLRTGKVLITSGSYQVSDPERVWDPATGAITLVPNPYYNLFCAGHAQLPDGRILFAGGYDPGSMGAANANIFDPVSQSWSAVPNMSYRRWYPSVTTLADGRMLVTSGAQTCSSCIAEIPEIFDPATNRFTRLTSARLNIDFYPFVFLLPDGRVLSAGSTESAYETRALDLTTGLWSMVDPVVRDGHSAVMFRPGRILKTGTAADSGTFGNAASTAYVLDMTQPSPAWRQVPSMSFPRAFQNSTILPDGTVLVTGGGSTLDGLDISKGMKTAELWSPATETWQTLSSGALSRLYHSTALLLPDGRVMIAGSGDDVGAVHERRAELFSPPYLFKGPRPVISAAPDLIQYGAPFTVVTPDAASITSVALIRPASVTHAFDEDQRYVPLTFTVAPGGLVVQAPENANLAPPGYYMLFIVNGNGVPSIAPFVHFAAPSAADTTAPSAPAALAAIGGLGTVSLTWTASTDNTAVSTYNVHRSLVPGFVPSIANRVAQVTATSYGSSNDAPGTYFYVVTAQDAAGNVSAPSNEAAVVVVGDTTSPSVAISSPLDGGTVTGSVAVTANAADNVGVVSVRFELDGAPLGAEDATQPYSATWDTTTASNGTHTLKAIARDAAGNSAESAVAVTVANAEPDTTAPDVAITAPAGGSTATGSVTITATASDAVAVTGVQFQIDGTPLGAELTTAPYSITWDTKAVANGPHTIVAVARDEAGNRAQASVSVSVSNDTTAPVVAVSAPAGGSTATGSIAITATATDDVAVTGVQFLVDGVELGDELLNAPYATTWDSTTASNGPHTIAAVARDAAGNTTQSVVTVSVFNDASAPVVSITSPASQATVSGSVAIVASATDDAGVTGVQFGLDGAPLGAELTSAPFSITWDTKTASNGSHTLTAIARDAAGKTTTSSVTVTVFNDTTAPVVEILSPASQSTVGGTILMHAGASDDVGVAGVQFRVDGVPLGVELTVAPYTISWDTKTASTGLHTVSASARDAAGNRTDASVTVTVFNDAVAPTVSITSPSGPGPLSGSVAISATATDDGVVTGVQFQLDGAPLGAELTNAPYALSWDTTTASNGPHTITAVARDAAGRTASASVTVSVLNDTTSPAISITAPASGATVNGAVAVTANASDDVGVASVQFLLDAAPLGAPDVTAPYSVTWDTTGVPDGPHTITAVARDAAGNGSQAGAVTVTVLNAAPPPPPPPPPAPAGLVAAYSFDEGSGSVATDASGNGNDGSIRSGTWVNGHSGTALSFNGFSSWVSIADDASLDLTTGMTLEAWVRPSSNNNTRPVIVKERSSGFSYGLFSSNGNGRPSGMVRTSSATRTAADNDTLPTNTWSHLAVTYNGSIVRLYVNGQQVASISGSGPILSSSGVLRIGGTSLGADYFRGLIDDVRIYDRALTAAEIQTDMATPVR